MKAGWVVLLRNTRTTDSLRPGRMCEFLARSSRACAVCALLTVIVVASVAGAFLLRSRSSQRPLIEGRIEPEAVVASATLGGRVKAVLARRGDHVEAGQILVRFEAEDLDARMEQARGILALAPAGTIVTTASFVERVPPAVWASLLQTDPVRLEAEHEYADALAAVERDGNAANKARLRRAETLRVAAFRRTDELRPQTLANLESIRGEADRMMRWLMTQRGRLDTQSPVGGIIDMLDLAVGEDVRPGTPVALVVLPGRWVVRARAPYPPGSPVAVLLPNGDRVSAITTDAGGEGQVRVLLSSAAANLRPGDAVRLEF